MACPMCGIIGIPREQFHSCKTCKHSRPHGLSAWEGHLMCKHPEFCVCLPTEDFCCNGWEAKR